MMKTLMRIMTKMSIISKMMKRNKTIMIAKIMKSLI